MENCEAVINLVGENIVVQRRNEEVKKRIYDSRINTTRTLVKAMLKRKNPSVFVSASGIHGDQGGYDSNGRS